MSTPEFFSSSVIGADVHKAKIVCCARRLEGNEWKKDFATFSTKKFDIFRMGRWCQQYDPDFVLMESTGIYWVSPLNYLERIGLKVYIVNPSSVKGMIGKKTDKNDAGWLATKANEGSFKPSFIPTDLWRKLRDLARNVTKQNQQVVQLKNRELKMFSEMGYRIDTVFSDPYGVNAERAKEAILAGKSNIEVLSCIDTRRLKASKQDLLEAFNGDLDPERVMVINANREVMCALKTEISAGKHYLLERVQELEPQLLDLYQTIPGISVDHAVTIVIELGGREFIEAFPSSDKFASWMGLCPGNNESGGKRRNCRSGHGNRALRSCLCEAAHAAARTNGTTLQSRYRVQRAKIGTKKAIISASHKLSELIFTVAKNGQPYIDPAVDYEAAAFAKTFKRHVKKAMQYKEKWQVDVKDLETGERFQSKTTSTITTEVNSTSASEANPATNGVPVAKTAPAAKAAPVAKTAPAAKAAPVAKTEPAAKAAPVAKTAPAAKAAPVAQTAPVVEATPVAKTAPVVEATPVAKTPLAVKATLVANTAPVVEATPVAKTAPVVEATPVAKTAPVVEATPLAKTPLAVKATLVANTAPVVEATPVAKTAPAANSQKIIHQQKSLFQLMTIVMFLIFLLASMQNYTGLNDPQAEQIDSRVKLVNLSQSLPIKAVSDESIAAYELGVTLTWPTAVPVPSLLRSAKPMCDNRTRGTPTDFV